MIVGIKSLEWVKENDGFGDYYTAEKLFGAVGYRIEETDGGFIFPPTSKIGATFHGVKFRTLEDVKAICQEDYERRILSSFAEEVPTDAWETVPSEATPEFLAETNGKPVLAYGSGEYFIAWVEFDPMEGGHVWMDNDGGGYDPTHYRVLPAAPSVAQSNYEARTSDGNLENRAFRAANRFDVPDEVRKLINELREQYLEEIAAIRSQNDKLREAIEPFFFGDETLETILFGEFSDDEPMTLTMPVGQYREARKSIAAAKEGAPKGAVIKVTSADNDLLAALKAIQKIGVLNPTNSPVVKGAIDNMVAAIAKAEGRRT